MPTCLHLLNSYLPITESFIWQYLRVAKKFPPLILAQDWRNVDRFPLAGDPFIRCTVKKSLPASFIARLIGRYPQVSYADCLSEISHHRPALIHAHFGYRAVVSLSLFRRLKLPVFTNFYGYDLSHNSFLQRSRSGYAELFRIGAGFFVEGPRMQKRLLALGCPSHKIHIKRIAIDPKIYPFRERTWDGIRPVRFLFVGRLVEKKGLDHALAALGALKGKIGSAPFTLTIIGDGPLRPALERQADEAGLTDKIQWAGYVPPADLIDVLDKHDILLQPSRTAIDGDSEGGAPTVLLEAQACGIPILSTLHDDIPYVVPDGKAGFLSPEGDLQAYSQNLERLLSHSSKWPDMGRAGREHILASHDVTREIDNVESLYASCI